MNLQHLKYAREVERCGSINKAAKNLYITQPYLSTCLKELEELVGVQLFKRSVQGVNVTAQGREFLAQANELITYADCLESKYKDKGLHGQTFKIASVRSALPMLSYISTLNNCDLSNYSCLGILETGMLQMIDAVYRNDASLGIIMYYAGQSDYINSYSSIKNLELYEIDSVPAHIIVSAKHDFNREIQVENADISQYAYATYGDYSESILNVQNECKLIGIDAAKKVIYVHDRHTLMYLLSNSDAFAIAHKFRKQDEENFGLVSIPVKKSDARVYFGYIKSKHYIIEQDSLEMIYIDELRRTIQEFK